MKKMVAILMGLLASALLIGISLAQTEDTEGADVAIPSYTLCPDFIQPTAVQNIMSLTSSRVDIDKCGKTLVRSPGDVLNLEGPSGNDLVYLWTVKTQGESVKTFDTKDISFTVPMDACLSTYTVKLVVSKKGFAGCLDSCQIKVCIDCECMPLNQEFCKSDDKSVDTRKSVDYEWNGHGTAYWWIAGHLYKQNKVTFDWTKKGAGIYGVAMVVYSDDSSCPCGLELPIKVCTGLVKIVSAPEAQITADDVS
jgi:hypothetical protein